MSERSDRLRMAMASAGVRPHAARDRWGWNYHTLRANLSGTTDFSYKKAVEYGARLKVRAEWLYDGAEPMRAPPPDPRRPDVSVPLISWVSAGQLAEVGQIEAIEEMERITVTGLPAGEYFALEVFGDSMDRVSPDGSRVIVRHDKSRPVPGGYYIFAVGGEMTFKRYYDDPVIRFEPFSLNPANRPIYPARDWEVVGQVVRSFIDLDRGTL